MTTGLAPENAPKTIVILEEQLAIAEQLQAIEESAGCWRNEHHPDMATGANIDAWLLDLRKSWPPNNQQGTNDQ